MNKICLGCGVRLQSNDEDKDGYVPKERAETAEYCKRCFRMMHYGERKSAMVPKSAQEIVKTVNKNAKYVVFLTDFIDVFDETMEIFRSIKVPKTLVISKSDIIPKNVSFEQIRAYLKKIYRVRDEIVFTSNKSKLNTFLKKIYAQDEVYFLGRTNSGKSTLINAIVDSSFVKVAKLTTSYKENTTQDFVRINLGKTTLIDSPGFVTNNFEVDKLTNISSEIAPITYQNKASCTYKLNDLFSINVDGYSSIVFYFSKSVAITRLYNKKIVGTTFAVKANSDIVICGLGFIKVTMDVRLTVPEVIMKYINVRPSIVGGNYE